MPITTGTLSTNVVSSGQNDPETSLNFDVKNNIYKLLSTIYYIFGISSLFLVGNILSEVKDGRDFFG